MFHESSEVRKDASADGTLNVQIVRGKHEGYGNEGRTAVWNWDQKRRKVRVWSISFVEIRQNFLSCVTTSVGKEIGKDVGMKADMSGD